MNDTKKLYLSEYACARFCNITYPTIRRYRERGLIVPVESVKALKGGTLRIYDAHLVKALVDADPLRRARRAAKAVPVNLPEAAARR